MAGMPTWTILGGGYQSYLKGDYSAAYEEWLPLAELGDAEAQYNLGVMYDEGAGRKADLALAAEWYQKAAEQGFIDAQTNLGIMYLGGQGVPKDPDIARKWLQKAAEQGDKEATQLLQDMVTEPA
ncbi:MAG: sel1 repeat family protein [Gammaproteobacteria bacterium]|nr:sel1 repeat family protein [Gammaproteobacteria bacterium]MDH5514031.1 sel1 repeat family protein [Gammaproteobacteria bacterium]